MEISRQRAQHVIQWGYRIAVLNNRHLGVDALSLAELALRAVKQTGFDWVSEDLPEAFALIGPDERSPLQGDLADSKLADSKNDEWAW